MKHYAAIKNCQEEFNNMKKQSANTITKKITKQHDPPLFFLKCNMHIHKKEWKILQNTNGNLWCLGGLVG